MQRPFLLLSSVALVLTVAAIGCSNDPRSERSLTGLFAPGSGPSSRPDSIPPGPPPPRPTPPPIVPVAFVSADTGMAGVTINTFWKLSNPDHAAFTTHWTLTDDQHWPGLPLSGDVTLAPLGTQVIDVQITVPNTATAGYYPIHMSVTQKHDGNATADGLVRVIGSPPDSLRATRLR
jgi:hypothetical protein